MYSFPSLELVSCSMSGSNCYFLTCIQVSQQESKVVWYSHLFKNFPQFAVVHIVRGFGIVSEAEVDAFLEFSCFVSDPADVGNLISASYAFSVSSLNIWKFLVHVRSRFMYCWGLAWRILSITLLAGEKSAIVR